jgi:LysM repeat protein
MTPESQAETAPEPTPEATPEPTPELQPAYFLYTVQPEDTVSAIAGVFGISRDYILWNNPDVIKDPNLLLVGEELLIPSVDGIIYRVKPGDTLSPPSPPVTRSTSRASWPSSTTASPPPITPSRGWF